MAGKAINITTTTAPHAISYPITTYCGLPHGHAVAMTLGYFFEINFNCTNIVDLRGAKYLKNTMKELYGMFGVNSPLECKNKWHHLMASIGLESDMESAGFSSANVNKIINNVDLQRLSNNPVYVSKNTLEGIFLHYKTRKN